MKEIKIEKGIKIPSGSKYSLKYPWDKMNEGDSFFIEAEHCDRSTVASNGKSWYSYNDKDFSVCSRREGKGFRFWKVKKRGR